MTATTFTARLQAELDEFRRTGVYKRLNYLDAPQGARTRMEGRGDVVILSSNNYLGLTNHPALKKAAIDAVTTHRAGSGSVRAMAGFSPCRTRGT